MFSSIRIRNMRVSDAYKVAKMHRRTIRLVNNKDYTPQQIAAWSSRPTGRGHAQSLKQETKYVAVHMDTKEIVGFCGFTSDGEMFIYVSAQMIGRGIGRMLMEYSWKQMKKRGLSKAHLDAALTAVGFYQKLGFRTLESGLHPMRNRKTGEVVSIECVKMERDL